MTPSRWKYIKSLKPAAPRYVHVSCEVGMIPHPLNPMLPATPYVERPGHTYNVGRNAAKRAKRAEARAARQRAVAASRG